MALDVMSNSPLFHKQMDLENLVVNQTLLQINGKELIDAFYMYSLQLKLSNPKYVEKYREILKSRGVHVGPQPQPVEHGEVWSDTGGFTTAVQETLAVGEVMYY